MKLVELLRKIGVDGARWVEENIDLQFEALRYLYSNLGDKNLLPALAVANALVSYQLSGKGEEYWWEFARWFSEHGFCNFSDAFSAFLRESKHNRRFVGAKLRRIEKAELLLKSFEPRLYYNNMVRLRDDLAAILGARKNAKTVVFAVKMFGYAMRILTGEFKPFPMEISLPVDSRVEKITHRLTKEKPTIFWQKIAKRSEIPPLHLDSILWPLYRLEARKKFLMRFGKIGKELITVLFGSCQE